MSARTPARSAPAEAEVWRLQDRREFLRRSLADAEREHAAGDLADSDYAVLRKRDEEALAAIERQLRDLGPTPTDAAPAGPEAEEEAEGGRPGRSRRWMLLAGVAAVVAGAVVLALSLSSSPRLPGQTPTGGIQLNPAQQVTEDLAQAAAEVHQHQVGQALALYRRILAVAPNQPEALAEWGWLTWQTASAAGNSFLEGQAETAERRGVAVEAGFAAPHLYLGTMRLQGDHDPAGAVAEYRQYLALGPPADQVAQAAPFIRQAFASAGQPLPAQVPAA